MFSEIAVTFGPYALIGALLVMLIGGFIKGVVGFALPMITVSGIGSFMPVDWAILALLLPGLITNVWQSLRSGVTSARESLHRYWRIFLVMPLVLALAAQVFTLLPESVLFIVLGLIVMSFACVELSGFRGKVSGSPKLEYVAAVCGGVSGGLSGVWGPPIMIYLLAKDVQKIEFIQTMGMVFLIGAVVLNLSHIQSGILSFHSAPFSALMIVPALLGMWLGYKLQDRLDQVKFRRATLFVLLFAGLNLLRRGIF